MFLWGQVMTDILEYETGVDTFLVVDRWLLWNPDVHFLFPAPFRKVNGWNDPFHAPLRHVRIMRSCLVRDQSSCV